MLTLIILCVLLQELMSCNGVRSPSIISNKSDACENYSHHYSCYKSRLVGDWGRKVERVGKNGERAGHL